MAIIPEDLDELDLGESDLGTLDLGESDLGTLDLGESDLGTLDLGESDLGTLDLGESNLGTLDLGEISSNTPLADEDPSFFEVMGQTVDQLQASGWAGVRVLGEQFENERMIEAGNRGVAFNEAQAAKYGRPMMVEDIENPLDDLAHPLWITFLQTRYRKCFRPLQLPCPRLFLVLKAELLSAQLLGLFLVRRARLLEELLEELLEA
jgi:hypothetical protein